jgi:hypothetical protein
VIQESMPRLEPRHVRNVKKVYRLLTNKTSPNFVIMSIGFYSSSGGVSACSKCPEGIKHLLFFTEKI